MTDKIELPAGDGRGHLHRFADWLDVWHVTRIFNAISAFAILLAVAAFAIDMVGRTEDRIARAWQLVTTKAPGNSGKIETIEYLHSENWWWPFKQRVPLVGIDLSKETHGNSVYLQGLRLVSARMPNANLSGARLIGANLKRTQLNNSNLSGADLAYSNLSYTYSSDVDFSSAILSRADISNSNLQFANLSDARLDYASFSGSRLAFANLTGASTVPEFTSPDSPEFTVDLSGVDLHAADLSDAILRGADFSDADLEDAILSGADLRQATFSDTWVANADFKDVKNLTQEQLNGTWAWLDLPPRNLPDGLSMQRLCFRILPAVDYIIHRERPVNCETRHQITGEKTLQGNK